MNIMNIYINPQFKFLKSISDTVYGPSKVKVNLAGLGFSLVAPTSCALATPRATCQRHIWSHLVTASKRRCRNDGGTGFRVGDACDLPCEVLFQKLRHGECAQIYTADINRHQ